MINHIFCTCGGIIQVNKRSSNFYCQKCNREYEFEEIRYDRLLCNIMTGWIFPVIEEEQMKGETE